ncbi:hypothetical protein ACWNT8_09340 [Pigmentibacter ruber]|uniref:hypothetical protein n=1 Tax=Pigmentibacter ruber TaxID=2683196 RepID=UPI00131CE1E5|nr:hypothetical protein [Pigmentibacter ruber]BFD32511.1 hypothetical protein GTC16762_21290 [Pigmentibacter ruber]
MDNNISNMKYEKRLIDNATCKRRFHLVFEKGSPKNPEVTAKCPHCGVVLFHEKDHPAVMIARDENLVKSPDGTETIIYDCKFDR